MRILITGGAGFVGKHLAKSLIKNNHSVTIFDNYSNSSEMNIKSLLDKVKFVKGDITNYDDVSNSIIGSEVVIHLASKINVQESFANPNLTKRVNVDGTKNLLEACKENQITNIIVASSAAVYGDCKDSKTYLSENLNTNPTSPYGESKLEMEQTFKSFSEQYGINTAILRFFNIYGVGQTPEYAGVITKFLQKIQENKPLEIYGDGLQTRDFVSIQDVVNSIYDTITNIEGKRGNIYNIASGKSISINDLAKLMVSISEKDLNILHSSPKKGDIKFSHADIALAEKDLGYQPKIDLKDGIRNLMKVN